MPATVYFGGAYTDPTTVDLLRELQRVSGEDILLLQGSYRPASDVSSRTHTGGGVVDINIVGWSDATIDMVVRTGRSMGAPNWHRTKAQGFSPHIHLIRADCADMSGPASDGTTAAWQVAEYNAGRNGLKGRAADDGPRDYVGMTWAKYTGSSAYRPPINTGGGTGTNPQKEWFEDMNQADQDAIRMAVKLGTTDSNRGESVSGSADRSKNGVGENTQAIHELQTTLGNGQSSLLAEQRKTNDLLAQLLSKLA